MNYLTLGILLADEPVNTGPDFGKASPVGLVVVILLLIAVLLLGLSMNRQLKKVPKSFDESETGTDADAVTDAGTEKSAGESGG